MKTFSKISLLMLSIFLVMSFTDKNTENIIEDNNQLIFEAFEKFTVTNPKMRGSELETSLINILQKHKEHVSLASIEQINNSGLNENYVTTSTRSMDIEVELEVVFIHADGCVWGFFFWDDGSIDRTVCCDDGDCTHF